MWETIRNAFKIKDVRNKILWTILLIVLYRLGCYITVPGLSAITFENSEGILGLLDSITGSALSQGTLFSLGISPYINASIIVQLLTVAIPALERMSKEGDEGKEKINKITRFVTLGLAIVSSVGVVLTLDNQNAGYINYEWLGGSGLSQIRMKAVCLHFWKPTSGLCTSTSSLCLSAAVCLQCGLVNVSPKREFPTVFRC